MLKMPTLNPSSSKRKLQSVGLHMQVLWVSISCITLQP